MAEAPSEYPRAFSFSLPIFDATEVLIGLNDIKLELFGIWARAYRSGGNKRLRVFVWMSDSSVEPFRDYLRTTPVRRVREERPFGLFEFEDSALALVAGMFADRARTLEVVSCRTPWTSEGGEPGRGVLWLSLDTEEAPGEVASEVRKTFKQAVVRAQ